MLLPASVAEAATAARAWQLQPQAASARSLSATPLLPLSYICKPEPDLDSDLELEVLSLMQAIAGFQTQDFINNARHDLK
jgi:hypothetical protein